MGFVEQSNTKKIYAYLTQLARKNILDGDEVDITVKYFSLHDNDVNYNISANIVNNSYNTLPSGFIPDITGDNQGCLFSIANGIGLSNFLGGVSEPPIVVNPEPEPEPITYSGNVTSSCVIIDDSSTSGYPVETGDFRIFIPDTNQGFTNFYVVTQIISFSSATETDVATADVLSSTTGMTLYNNAYNDIAQTNGVEIILNSTFKFSDNGYSPRKADSYNFTVYAKDILGNTVKIVECKDINCSIRQYGAIPYIINSDVRLDYLNQPNPNSYLTSIGGAGYAIFVIDNGNRRRDLDIKPEDFASFPTYSPYNFWQVGNLNFNDYFLLVTPTIGSPDDIFVRFDDDDDEEDDFVSEQSPSVIIPGVIVREATIGGLTAFGAWAEWNAPYQWGSDDTNLVPRSIFWLNPNAIPSDYIINPQYTLYRGDWDALHPTVIPFDNMGLEGFKIKYVQVRPLNTTLDYTFGNYAPSPGSTQNSLPYILNKGFGPENWPSPQKIGYFHPYTWY